MLQVEVEAMTVHSIKTEVGTVEVEMILIELITLVLVVDLDGTLEKELVIIQVVLGPASVQY